MPKKLRDDPRRSLSACRATPCRSTEPSGRSSRASYVVKSELAQLPYNRLRSRCCAASGPAAQQPATTASVATRSVIRNVRQLQRLTRCHVMREQVRDAAHEPHPDPQRSESADRCGGQSGCDQRQRLVRLEHHVRADPHPEKRSSPGPERREEPTDDDQCARQPAGHPRDAHGQLFRRRHQSPTMVSTTTYAPPISTGQATGMIVSSASTASTTAPRATGAAI